MSESTVLTIAEDALEMIRQLRDNEPGEGEFALSIEVTGFRGPQFSYELAFVPLAELQAAIGQPGRVNAVFAPLVEEGSAEPDLVAAIRGLLRLEDLGLEARQRDGILELTSRQVFVRPALESALEEAADELGAKRLPISTYLANSTRLVGRSPEGARSLLPYSTITSLRTDAPPELGRLVTREGTAALEEGEVLLNAWAARDLGARPGDQIEISYYVVGPREELETRVASFRVRGVVAMEGLGSDPGLTPDFPGISDAEDMGEWDPSFPVDLSLVGERDEELLAGVAGLLAEAERTGGECLWTGCVPSKALIAAARRAHDMRTADHVGLTPHHPDVDLGRIMRRVHDVIATIEPHDSPARLRSKGVEVVRAGSPLAPVLVLLAVGISVATVRGRYHYAADTVAGVAWAGVVCAATGG